MTTNFNNILKGIEGTDEIVRSASELLLKEFHKKTAMDLLTYLKAKHRADIVYRLLLGLFEDRQFDLDFVTLFCDTLKSHFPYDKWDEFGDELERIILSNEFSIGQDQLKTLAYTLEILYAKGILKSKNLLTILFRYINEPGETFGILNKETVIIRAAKATYSCNQHNFASKINELISIKHAIEKQDLRGLKRIVNYYLGLCYEKFLNDKQTDYMRKSSDKGFYLASLYREYSKFNFETSKKPEISA